MIYNLGEYSGKVLDYMTEKQLRSGEFVHAKVTSVRINSDHVCTVIGKEQFNDIIRDSEGVLNSDTDKYEWTGISTEILCEQQCSWVLSYEDYYSGEQYDSSNVECGAGDGFYYKKAAFTIEYNEVKYDDCLMVLIIDADSITDNDGIHLNVLYRVPKGYDGCILGFHNSSALTEEQIEKGLSDPAASLGIIEKATGDLYLRLKY